MVAMIYVAAAMIYINLLLYVLSFFPIIQKLTFSVLEESMSKSVSFHDDIVINVTLHGPYIGQNESRMSGC